MRYEIDYSLYLVTDRELMSTQTLEEAVERAIQGGCTIVQLREKMSSSLEFYQNAIKIKTVTDKYKIPLIINDRADIALAIDAAGVHVGQSDLPAEVVRKIIGKDKILGVSANTAESAIKAADAGANYIGVGALYSTNTKTDAELISKEQLLAVRKAVSIPIVGIGGINHINAGEVAASGIDGIAVVSAIIAQKDIKKAAQELLGTFKSKRKVKEG